MRDTRKAGREKGTSEEERREERREGRREDEGVRVKRLCQFPFLPGRESEGAGKRALLSKVVETFGEIRGYGCLAGMN